MGTSGDEDWQEIRAINVPPCWYDRLNAFLKNSRQFLVENVRSFADKNLTSSGRLPCATARSRDGPMPRSQSEDPAWCLLQGCSGVASMCSSCSLGHRSRGFPSFDLEKVLRAPTFLSVYP